MRRTLSSGAVLAASLALVTSACGDDGTDTAEDPAADASTSPSTSAEPSQEPEQVTFVDFGEEPALKPRYRKAALKAVSDDLITMVPSVLPDGWTAVGGGYQADPQWWRMEFTSPTGDVTLDQMPGTAKDVLAEASGLTAADDVDLSDYGTGTWSAWQASDGLDVLALDLKGSTVVLQGASPEEVRALAETLLPAEDAAFQE
ncbi:hypothetical protein J2X46_000407 [Nocardioides sp. BE266]|uniref:hypothetical protein n=1 Tax=Nocardioides sp. BE266 TaxID=2817725 RepID=UPI002859D645|nr:hypothetical protein [Nocardioides sp. BE266]MDR7251435.1 hypothetical protein [Nocardioides sp. BE266]